MARGGEPGEADGLRPEGRLLIPVGLKPGAVRASRIDAPVRRLSGSTMGTGWSVAFVAPESLPSSDVLAVLNRVFALIIRQMSNWEPGSDLCRFNQEPGWRILAPEFFHVLTRALAIADLTGGAYDPSLGACIAAGGFGPPTGLEAATHAECALGGWRRIQVDADNGRVLQPGAVALDLSSIAKGYAVDLCARGLTDLGIPSFLMEIGGEFAGRGVKPDAQPWWVELELSDVPLGPGEPAHTDIALVNLAVATSGDFVRRREGVCHLLDGRTGQPVGDSLSGVAVMHPSCMEADAWATALYVLGPDEGLAMANAQNLAAVFALRTPEGARSRLSEAAQQMLG